MNIILRHSDRIVLCGLCFICYEKRSNTCDPIYVPSLMIRQRLANCIRMHIIRIRLYTLCTLWIKLNKLLYLYFRRVTRRSWVLQGAKKILRVQRYRFSKIKSKLIIVIRICVSVKINITRLFLCLIRIQTKVSCFTWYMYVYIYMLNICD